MDRRYNYIGCFFSFDELLEKLQHLRTAPPLYREISDPHVTFKYRPEEVDLSLFGVQIAVTVIGYGNNGRNEGVKVSLSSDDPQLQRMIDEIPIPHITLSVSEESRAVYTAAIDFAPVEPVQLTGIFGGFTSDRRVDLHGKEEEVS